jgi:hypothetical protein
MYKLRDWVDETQLRKSLSFNERAVEYLENHEYLIDDEYIFCNENAIHIIEKRMQNDIFNDIYYNKNATNFLRNRKRQLSYTLLCQHAHLIELMDELINAGHLNKINWHALSKNPAAIHILNDPKYYTYIDWNAIIYNKNAHDIIKNNLHKVIQYWSIVCQQPHLIDIIEQNMDMIDWISLSENYNAIHILEQHTDKIHAWRLCLNKNGFPLLLLLNHVFDNNNYYDKHILLDYFDYCEIHNIPFNLIRRLSEHGYTEKHMKFLQYNNNYFYLSKNPNIFEYDYKRMRETRQSLLWYNDIKK